MLRHERPRCNSLNAAIQSHYGSRLHFGLGRNSRIDRIEIRWHGGHTEILENVPVDQFHTIIEPIR